MASLAPLPFLAGGGPAAAQTVHEQGTTSIVERTHELLKTAGELRGLSFTGELPVELVDPQRMREVVEQEVDDQLTPEMDKQFSSLYALLGLMRAGSSLRAAYLQMAQEQAAGLYDPSGKRFYVIDVDYGDMLGSMFGNLSFLGNLAEGLMQGMGYDLSQTMSDTLIIHELTHAIDDQHFDLEITMKALQAADSDDATLAYQSLVEGDATRIMNDYASQKLGLDSSLLAGMGDMSSQMALGMLDYNPFLERIMIEPYYKGEAFVRYVLDQGGQTALDRAFTDPPTSMEQVIHPERYLPARDYPSEIADPDLSAALPGWQMEGQDTLGEFITGVMFELGLNDTELGARVADGWDGDRITTWRAANNDLAGGWVIVWDNNDEAREFFENYLDLVDARYSHGGTWKNRGTQSALYTGAGRAVAIEVCENTVVIAEGVPENRVDAALEALWNTPIIYR
jgi:hypothetical protein